MKFSSPSLKTVEVKSQSTMFFSASLRSLSTFTFRAMGILGVVAANYIVAVPKVQAEPAYCSTIYAVDSSTTSRIHTLNQATGAYTQVGTVTNSILSAANAVQPSTGKMFYVSRSGAIKTYVWDPSNNTNTTLSGSFTIPTGEVTIRAAFAPNGKLYVATNAGAIYEVNPTNGSQLGSVITLRDSANQALSLNGNGDMAFDGNGVLYLFNDANLYTVDLSSQTAYLLSTTPGATFNSLAFGSNAKLFGYNSASNMVFSINTNTGVVTTVGSPSLGSGIVGSDFGSCAQPIPNLTVLKSYTKVGGSAGSTIRPGDVVEYTVTITNIGDVPATNSTFADAVPAGATYVVGSTLMNSTAVADGSGGTFPFQTARTINSDGLRSGVVGTGAGYQVTLKYRVNLNTVNPPASVVNQGTVFYLGNLTPGVVSDDPNTVAVNDATTITYPVVSLQGTVFNDADGSKLLNGTESGTNAGGLNAVLVDSTNKVVVTTTVAANGTYTFNSVPANANYTVQITTATATIGSTPPAVTLPSNWVSTGENLNSTIDGTVDSKLTVAVTTSNVTGINFGIEQLPDTTAVAGTAQSNPGGTTTVQVPTLAGTDPEDGVLGSGKSFKIVTLPTNGTLTYNGSAVTAGQTISSYNPVLLQLDPNDGAITVSFTYGAVDAAGQVDPTPTTVTMPFTTVAKVLLVKRITAINGDRTKNLNDNTPLNVFVDDTTSSKAAEDNDSKWVTNYLKGAINAGKVKPGDTIEYTIYFLNTGNANANTVRICDRIRPNQIFQPNGYGVGTGVQVQMGTSPVINLTNANDSSDRTQFIAAGTAPPGNCNITAANTDGTLVVDITGAAATGNPALVTMPGATAAGSPNDSYGFFRFITQVNP
jgi:uncharacterized repeat protein (TIGR01451 family)